MDKKKVYHYNRFMDGGAGIAVKKIVQSIETTESSFSNYIISSDKHDPVVHSDIQKESYTGLQKIKNKIFRFEENYNKKLFLKNFSWKEFEHFGQHSLFYKTLPEKDADIIHLHWISDFIDFPSFFSKIDVNFPIIITLHDYNVFTGGCHYPFNCNKYIEGCHKCYQIKSKRKKDLAAKNYGLKKYFLDNHNNFHIVCTTSYLLNEAKKSAIFKNARSFSKIPYPITNMDTDKKQKRINSDCINIGFGATDINRPTKGLQYLIEALNMLDCKKLIVLHTFGSGNFEYKIDNTNVSVTNWGKISKKELSLFFDSIDFFVFPSIQEAFGQTVIESLIYRVPVIAFNVGVVQDVIINGKNGFICNEISSVELKRMLAKAIDQNFPEFDKETELQLTKFDANSIGKSIIELYKRIL